MTLLFCSICYEVSILKFIFWSKLTAKYSSSHYPQEEEKRWKGEMVYFLTVLAPFKIFLRNIYIPTQLMSTYIIWWIWEKQEELGMEWPFLSMYTFHSVEHKLVSDFQ